MSADEKGPQTEPSTCPAEAKVGHSPMRPVVVEEYNRSVMTTAMMVMVETMVMVVPNTMVMVVPNTMVMVASNAMMMVMDSVMVPVPPVVSPAPPPSTPPLHRQLRFASQDAHSVALPWSLSAGFAYQTGVAVTRPSRAK